MKDDYCVVNAFDVRFCTLNCMVEEYKNDEDTFFIITALHYPSLMSDGNTYSEAKLNFVRLSLDVLDTYIAIPDDELTLDGMEFRDMLKSKEDIFRKELRHYESVIE